MVAKWKHSEPTKRDRERERAKEIEKINTKKVLFETLNIS